MLPSNQDDSLLLIRCPSCGQRFKVGEDLRDKTVECGGCEHRFRINEDVIVRGRKFYPGERKDASLNRFQRVPLVASPVPAGTTPMRYAEAPPPVTVEPASPQRIIAGVVGVAGMIFVALLLLFGASRGGTLDGMTTDKRLMMAGFTGLLGVVLLLYANPRARRKAFGVGLLLSMGLMAIPFFFTEGSVPLASEPVNGPVTDQLLTEQKLEATKSEDLRNRIGTAPLEAEIKRLAQEGSTKHAVGIWLRDLREQHRFLVRDYILRVTGADPPLVFYPRGQGDFLLIVTGINQSLDEVAGIASKLGKVDKIYPEISVVEIRVNNEGFVEGPIEKLTDKENPAFYDLNKRELESIDLVRVGRAVQRLADAEPKIYRSDITRKLISLLGEKGVEFKGDLCHALAVWSEQPGPAGEAALVEAKNLLERKAEVPQEMIALIVKEKNPAVVPILDELWFKNPTHWEQLYGEVGPPAEAAIIRRFPRADGGVRRSAARLLGRVGGADSLPVLENATVVADAELKVLIEKSTASIRSRLGRE